EFRRAEEDLRFTQSVVDKMPDAIYWAGEDGRLVYVNEAACAMVGYPRDELLALRVYDVVDDYSAVKWQAHWDGLKQHGGRRFETRHRCKDGSIVPVEVQTLIVASGDRTYACAIARDIRRRKAMEAALRASEAKFSALFALSPVALTITRIADGVFLAANEEFVQLSGFTHAELAGHTALDLNLYADPAQRNAIAGATLRNGRVAGHPATIRTKDGATSECLVSAAVEEIDGVPCFLAGIVDVGPLRAVEAALRTSEEKFSSLFALSPVGLAITRVEDGVFVEINAAFAAMTGYTREELLGHTALEHHLYADPTDRATIVAEIARNGQVTGYPAPMRTKDGVLIDCLLSMKRVVIDGASCYLAGFIDMSPLRQAQEAVRASEAKFATLFEMSPISLTIARAEDGVFVDANSAALQANGYTREDFLGHTALELNIYVDTDERAALQAAIGRDGRVSNWPVKMRSKRGDIHECLMSVTAVDIDGKPCYLAGVVDVDPLRQVEAALRASETKFSSFFELSPIAEVITRVDDGCFVAVNAAFEEMSGYSRDEVTDRTALELNLYADPVERERLLAAVRREGKVYSRPIKFRVRDGGVAECLISVATVTVSGVECYLAGIIDMQPLRTAEAALHAQRAAMLALLENTDSIIWSVDTDYRLTACNSVYRRMVSATLGREPVIGDSVFAAAPAATVDEWRPLYNRAFAGERYTVELERRIHDNWRWLELRFNPVRTAAGEITGVTVLGRDITEHRQAARQIEEHLAEISLYYDTAPAGLAVFDTDLRFVRINKTLAAMNGVPVEDHIGRTVAEVVPLLEEQARRLAATILATGEPVTDIEIVGETPADPGITHTWREHWYPIKRSDGTIIGFNVTAEDITERKRTHELLERSQKNLARAQEIGQLGSYEWDVAGRRLEWSGELYRVFGVDRDFPLTYEAIAAMIHPDDRAVNDAHVHAALASGDRSEFELRIVRPDGALRHIFQSIEITRNAAGAPVKLFGVMQDITERKLAEDALRRSERNLNESERIGASGSWDYVVETDTALWSANMYRLVDVEPGSTSKRSITGYMKTVVHPDDQARVMAALRATIEHGSPYDTEYRVVHRDGSVRDIHAIAETITNDAGVVVRLIGRIEDITEAKQAAAEREQLQAQLAQAQKMETVGRLAGGIAHDFNNMLAVILLRTEMALLTVAEGTPLHRSLTTIYATAQRSANLVQQLLGFARKQTIAPKVVDLNEAVPAMLPMLGKLIGEEIEVRWSPGDDLWPVKMDPSQLDQVLTNLCVNARDAIEGIGKITISTGNATVPHTPAAAARPTSTDEHVVLTVADTGRGIAPDVLEHIFEPFFTTKGVGKGTGLGLATVEGIVEQNKGHIHVTSTPGLGTTFAVYLPRYAEPVPAPDAPGATTPVRGDGRAVMLVEDEQVVLEMASEALQSLGYTVVAFSSPAAALRAVQEESFAVDLLITDVIMPEMNGALLAERIRKRWPALKMLFVSGYPADYMADRGVLPGDATFLAKPFTRQSLAAKVAAVLGIAT
ncbi:MAG: PAS domain S-box protein, partial [Caldilinea sp.]|nr:PAS domain S-box protein [Caldilinea sp.]